jgi:putative pyrroloquinoline-quinone binding quinoprotein
MPVARHNPRLSPVAFFAAVGALVVARYVAGQQPGLLIFSGRAPQIELTEPQINKISGALASRLEQARALAAAKNWDEAVDIYRDLATEKTDRVVSLAPDRYVSLRTYCNIQLSRIPAEGLTAYRRRVDALAERWCREGLKNRDVALLSRVANEFFCSSWGDDALAALGELALELADYDTARHAWEQLSPQLRDPTGRSTWLALRGIDLNAHWQEVEGRWTTRDSSPDWLAYPDTTFDLAEIRAWLVLVSIRAGELDRASLELDVFRRMHPNATGRLAGQTGPLVPALDKLLTAAREWKPSAPSVDWPTFAGSQTRTHSAAALPQILLPVWERPIEIKPPIFVRRTIVAPGVRTPAATIRESDQPLSCYPVSVDGTVLFSDAAGIHAVRASDGKPTITPDGIVYREESTGDERQEGALPLAALAGVAHGVPRLTLNVVNWIVYGRAGDFATSHAAAQRASGDRIVGLDLNREGLLTLRLRPEDAGWSFDGTPVCDGTQLYVAMRHSGATPTAAVACYDITTGNELWRTSVGSADTPAGSIGDEITHNLLTLAGDRIYFNTNLGLIASLDAANGEICWLAKYDRATGAPLIPGTNLPLHFDRDPSPCVYSNGLIIVAPSDTAEVFALVADTGKTIWRTKQLSDATQLLGVAGDRLIASGNRLSAVDVYTGNLLWRWPESETAGIRGMGRGLVAGDEVYWPTRNEIYVLDATTGARRRPPIALQNVSDVGANLAVCGNNLIVAGYDKLQAYGAGH